MTESTTFSSGRKASGEAPEFRCLHFNDVYHIEAGDKEPVGGAARFVNLVNQYRNGEEYKDLPGMLTFFSGDAYNPSLESTVSKHAPFFLFHLESPSKVRYWKLWKIKKKASVLIFNSSQLC